MPAVLKALLQALVSAIVSAVGSGGLMGFVLSKILMYGGQDLYDLVKGIVEKYERAKAQQAAARKDLPIINNPDPAIPSEDKGKAYEDLINSGRG